MNFICDRIDDIGETRIRESGLAQFRPTIVEGLPEVRVLAQLIPPVASEKIGAITRAQPSIESIVSIIIGLH